MFNLKLIHFTFSYPEWEFSYILPYINNVKTVLGLEVGVASKGRLLAVRGYMME